MCDFFQANPWKPLLCTNCHQNRSGHQNIDKCEHTATDLPSSTSTMHLYEEIMAQYFTTNLNTNINSIIENDMDDEDSFSDEELDVPKPSTIEFIQNQSMINTQGIILMGPNLPTKEVVKKTKKMNLLKKSKSNADECLKKSDIIESNSSKLWWFKVKKSQGSSVISNEPNKSNVSTPTLTHQKIRVLPELNKLTLNEALSIARRQHSHEPKLNLNDKTVHLNYGSTTSSSSTQSSNEYDTNCPVEESTYLTAVSPYEKNDDLINIFDKTNQLIIAKLTDDLRILIEEYKKNLPVAHFQTFKSFLNQYETKKVLSTEAIYYLLLQILDESSQKSITYDHFLITYHSTIPILVSTTISSNKKDDEESLDEFIKNLIKKYFHSSSLPLFNDIPTFKNQSYRFLFNQIFQSSDIDFDKNLSVQRVKLLELFWKKIPSLRSIQINQENERFIFTYYYLVRYLVQSD